MKKKSEIMNELDDAINAMDIRRIDQGLEALADIEPLPFQAENSKLFAARIKKMNEENLNMKISRKFIKAAVVAATIGVMGITAYAANALNVFSFIQDGKIVVVRTTENIDGNAMGVQSNPEAPIREEDALPAAEYTFSTAADAEKELDIKIVLPSATAQMSLEHATGMAVNADGMDSRNVSLTYADQQGRNMYITATKLMSDSAVISEYDLGDNTSDNYINEFGTDFILFNNADQTTYFAAVGDYEYSIAFTGYSIKEQKEIVDTLDLSEYK